MTLISVIGDYFSSVAPVFYHFKDKIKKHIIISDSSKRDSKNALKFRDGTLKFSQKYNLDIKHMFYTINEDSLKSLEKAERFILDESEGEIFINTTDGLSTVNTYFSLRLMPQGAKIVSYDMFDNEINIIDLKGVTHEKINGSIPIKDHFMLKGMNVLETKDKQFAHRYSKEIKLLFTKHFKSFRRFIGAFSHTKNSSFVLYSEHQFPEIFRILSSMGILRYMYSKDFYKMITGDLFEYYVYLTVKELDFDDVEVGVLVEHDGFKNEFDILLMKDNHLHIIECKNRRVNDSHYKRGINLEPLFYKYATLKPIIDDESKVAVVISSYFDKEPHERVITRALSHDVAFITANRKLKDNLENFFLKG